MATYLDNFTGTDETSLDAHVADSGHTYVTAGVDACELLNNRLISTNAGGTWGRAVGDVEASGYTIDFTLEHFTNVTENRAGVIVLEGTDFETAYWVYWNGPMGRWELWTFNTLLDSSVDTLSGTEQCRLVVDFGTPARARLFVHDGSDFVLRCDSDNGSAVDQPDSPGTVGVFQRGVMTASTGTHIESAGVLVVLEPVEIDAEGATGAAGEASLNVPGVSFRDTYTDANGTGLAAHVSDSGHTYVANEEGSVNDAEILNNRLISTASGSTWARAVGDLENDSFTLDFTLEHFTNVANNRSGIVVLEGSNWERSLWAYWNGTAGAWQVLTWTTSLASSSDTLDPGTYLCRAVVDWGTPARIRLFVHDGDDYVLRVDSNSAPAGDKPNTPNAPGVFVRGVMSASTGTHIDSVQVLIAASELDAEGATGVAGAVVLEIVGQIDAEGETGVAGEASLEVGTQGPAWIDRFEDDFVSVNGASPNPQKWELETSAGSTATIQGNALQFVTGGPGSIGGWEDYARLVAKQVPSLPNRVDFPVTIPSQLENWFYLTSVRGNGLWATDPTFPNFPREGYWLQIAGRHGAADNAVAFVGKAAPDGSTKVDLSAQAGHELPEGVFDLLARFEVFDDGPNVRVRASVRPASAGPIPEGEWDIETLDDSGTIFTDPGVLQIGQGGAFMANDLRTLTLNEIELQSDILALNPLGETSVRGSAVLEGTSPVLPGLIVMELFSFVPDDILVLGEAVFGDNLIDAEGRTGVRGTVVLDVLGGVQLFARGATGVVGEVILRVQGNIEAEGLTGVFGDAELAIDVQIVAVGATGVEGEADLLLDIFSALGETGVRGEASLEVHRALDAFGETGMQGRATIRLPVNILAEGQTGVFGDGELDVEVVKFFITTTLTVRSTTPLLTVEDA